MCRYALPDFEVWGELLDRWIKDDGAIGGDPEGRLAGVRGVDGGSVLSEDDERLWTPAGYL